MVCAHSMDDSMHCLGLCFFWLFTGYKAEVSVMGKRINYIIPLFFRDPQIMHIPWEKMLIKMHGPARQMILEVLS
jgi:hypothetical protein